MSQQKDSTTLVCLFHDEERAQATINDLRKAGIAQSSIKVIGGPNAPSDALEKSELAALGMPDKDYDHLKQGLRDGGFVVAVSAGSKQSDVVEDIFEKHSAHKIDETQAVRRAATAATPLAAVSVATPVAGPAVAETVDGQTAIPVVEEELVVGKRLVNQGGVRVYRRVVEIPVEESVNLREEHVVMERRPVDRAVTVGDQAFEGRTIELTETAEEAVVAKNARVVEEVLVGKTASQHVETIHDSVRKTEVEVEELPVRDTIDTTRRK